MESEILTLIVALYESARRREIFICFYEIETFHERFIINKLRLNSVRKAVPQIFFFEADSLTKFQYQTHHSKLLVIVDFLEKAFVFVEELPVSL